MVSLTRAGRAEILRSAQKDDEFCQELQAEISLIVGDLTGHRLWVARNKHVFDGAAKFVYKLFTTLKNLQTLGEEYTGIVQLDQTGIELPSKLKLLSSVLIESCGVIALLAGLRQLELRIRESPLISPLDKDKYQHYLTASKRLSPFLEQFHKTLFYLFGIYYNFSKRCTGITYALVRPWKRDSGTKKAFHWIGIASSLYLLASFIHSLRNGHFERFQGDTELGQRSTSLSGCDPSRRCSLCLEEMKGTSCTPCGHLFCWACILEWLSSKSECPLCREPTQPSRVVLLQNFENAHLV